MKDGGAAPVNTPLESQRSWERQAEMNILDRLEKAGLLAMPGPVDDVLDTVVNNLIASANLGIEAKCRVLLTTPLETFSVGQTIVISRGLLDVLPDEASLATALAAELAHIALGHHTDTHFAFYDRTMLPDEELLNRLQLGRPAGADRRRLRKRPSRCWPNRPIRKKWVTPASSSKPWQAAPRCTPT